MKKCKRCGKDIPESKLNNSICSECQFKEPDIQYGKMQYIIPIAIILIISVILLSSGSNSNTNSQKSVSQAEAIQACKSYIADQFGRSKNIMRHKNVKFIDGFSVEIYYTRTSDNSVWRNICRIKNDKIIWAGLFSDGQGRWRYEDEEPVKNYLLN
ncbi:hypothetical protein [Idiomarina sp.]|uniref:hypothetical protein n=1 Tax=Idiomarina sp. TaxID=1874361 RepID=UPI0025C4773B|nr:hypothetical protein [Idiomarina sp.]